MINPERCMNSKEQKIILLKNDYKELRILDIGGGGEGIIGSLYGKNVVSIDLKADELLETKNDSLKIVMDASEMQFISDSFHVATLFFSLMYMNYIIKKRVLLEVFRVLKPSGVIEIWDGNIPKLKNNLKDIYLHNLAIQLPEKVIKTTYGVKIDNKEQNFEIIKNICEEVGFKLVDNKSNNETFYLKLKKE